jgi:hypothetical protein
VLELFDRLAKLTVATDQLKFTPLRPGEIYKSHLSGRKAMEILGWQSTVPIAEGLRHTVKLSG